MNNVGGPDTTSQTDQAHTFTSSLHLSSNNAADNKTDNQRNLIATNEKDKSHTWSPNQSSQGNRVQDSTSSVELSSHRSSSQPSQVSVTNTNLNTSTTVNTTSATSQPPAAANSATPPIAGGRSIIDAININNASTKSKVSTLKTLASFRKGDSDAKSLKEAKWKVALWKTAKYATIAFGVGLIALSVTAIFLLPVALPATTPLLVLGGVVAIGAVASGGAVIAGGTLAAKPFDGKIKGYEEEVTRLKKGLTGQLNELNNIKTVVGDNDKMLFDGLPQATIDKMKQLNVSNLKELREYEALVENALAYGKAQIECDLIQVKLYEEEITGLGGKTDPESMKTKEELTKGRDRLKLNLDKKKQVYESTFEEEVRLTDGMLKGLEKDTLEVSLNIRKQTALSHREKVNEQISKWDNDGDFMTSPFKRWRSERTRRKVEATIADTANRTERLEKKGKEIAVGGNAAFLMENFNQLEELDEKTPGRAELLQRNIDLLKQLPIDQQAEVIKERSLLLQKDADGKCELKSTTSPAAATTNTSPAPVTSSSTVDAPGSNIEQLKTRTGGFENAPNLTKENDWFTTFERHFDEVALLDQKDLNQLDLLQKNIVILNKFESEKRKQIADKHPNLLKKNSFDQYELKAISTTTSSTTRTPSPVLPRGQKPTTKASNSSPEPTVVKHPQTPENYAPNEK